MAAPATHASASTTRRRTVLVTAPLWAGAVVLLTAPTFAAFRSGGFGVSTQLIPAVAMLAVLALIALTAPWPPLPGGLALAALGALTAYAAWTGLSIGWARILDRSVHDVYRVGMYVAALGLALAVMRVRAVRRAAPAGLL